MGEHKTKTDSTEKPAAEKLPNWTRREFLATTAAAGALLFAAETNVRAANDQNMHEKTAAAEIIFLADYSTTVLESAVSLINGTHDNIVLTNPNGLQRRTAGTKPVVGFAATSTFSTDLPDERGKRENVDYWNYVFNLPAPKIAVSVDQSRQPGTGSSWGQLNAHIHRALGCRGVLTNGGVRDIGEFEKLNFAVFSNALTVGHGSPHFLSFGEPITLFGARINPGAVVVADEHGAIVIPTEHLPFIREAAAEIERRVAGVAAYCQSADFTPAGLLAATNRMKPATAWKPAAKR